VAALFFVHGVVGASWVVRIPDAQEQLGLSTGVLGFSLLAIALGSLPAMPIAGWLTASVGSRPVAIASGLAFCLLVPLPLLAPSLPLFVAALLCLGMSMGAMDVGMNIQGVGVERAFGRPLMSSFHAIYSIGSMGGAAVGGVLAGLGIGAEPHLVVVGISMALAMAFAGNWLIPARADTVRGPAFARPSRPLLGLGILGFCVLMGEGAMADWSAVYLRGTLNAGPALSAAGYAVFSATMMLGRLAGDWLTLRVGPLVLVRFGGLIAAVGLGIGLLSGQTLLTLVGFGCVGAGFSTIVPNVYSAAGRVRGIPPGPALAAVTTVAYFGFLSGPPLIGLIAEVITLRGALAIVVVLGVAISWLAPAVQREPGAPG
jgi:MFS family permease